MGDLEELASAVQGIQNGESSGQMRANRVQMFAQTSVAPASADRPIAGIIVAGVLGITGFLWANAVLFKDVFVGPTGGAADQVDMLFPAMKQIGVISNTFQWFGNTSVVIGVLLSLSRHRGGNGTVRTACYLMLGEVIFLSVLCTAAMAQFSKLAATDPSTSQ